MALPPMASAAAASTSLPTPEPMSTKSAPAAAPGGGRRWAGGSPSSSAAMPRGATSPYVSGCARQPEPWAWGSTYSYKGTPTDRKSIDPDPGTRIQGQGPRGRGLRRSARR